LCLTLNDRQGSNNDKNQMTRQADCDCFAKS
jgi:hypothetical protein